MKYLVKRIKHIHNDIDWEDIVAETTSKDVAEWLVNYYMRNLDILSRLKI